MVPLGYLYKYVSERPEWLAASQVVDVYSLSNCLSKDFADYVNHWKHNGFWLFDSPAKMLDLAKAAEIPLHGTKLFYYEAYEQQFDSNMNEWTPIPRASPFDIDVVVPAMKTLEGFDIATFAMGNMAECSPLSCNALASTVSTNAHCLLGSLEEAIGLVESFELQSCEPGPYRLIAVYSVAEPGT